MNKSETNFSSVLHRELSDCPCGGRTRIESVHDVKWGQWSMNFPTLWAMNVAITEFAGQWDVFINLSGDALPVYSQERLADILKELPYNFVTSSSCETGFLPTNVYTFPTWWHKRLHYTKRETVSDVNLVYKDYSLYDASADSLYQVRNQTIVTHFGSQWIILQANFCHWLVDQLRDDRPESLASLYRDYLIHQEYLMTDETFLASLLMVAQSSNSLFQLPRVDDSGFLLWKNGSISNIWAIRYERMDEHMPTAFGYFPTQQRYEVPNSYSESGHVESVRPWGPYFLGVYDLGSIRESGALFVRKVSERIDSNMVRLLPVHHESEIPWVDWPNEVALGKKPDWESIKAALLARQAVEQQAVNQEAEKAQNDEEL